jgi:endonuclease/exonuclease/phosphatase (EEP) superfamily protein YafD
MGSRTSSLRILTANLRHEYVDAGAFGEILDAADADVVAVQELSHPAAAHLEARYRHHDLRCSAEREGIGIAVRHPARFQSLDLGGRLALRARLDPESWPGLGDGLDVVTLHLANPVAWPPWRMVRSRRRQVGALRSAVDGLPQVVVVGDCNASPLWPAYRRIREFLGDGAATRSRAAGERPPRTWGPFPGGPKLLRIDHVWVRGVVVVSLQRIDVPGSDHAGLLASVGV